MSAPDFVSSIDLEDYRAGDAETIVGQVQAAVRSYCGWHISPSVTETLTLDGSGGRHLWLPSLHVTDIASVTNVGEVVAVDSYDWSASGYIERRSDRWSTRPRSITVTLTHGHEFPPADLVGVIVGVADRVRSTGGTVREQAGQVSLQFGTFNGVAGTIALLAHEREILDRYRVPTRA